MEEVFVEIKGQPNYQISNLGRVYRKAHIVIGKDGKKYTRNGMYIKAYMGNRGYFAIDFGGKHYLTHRLLAINFLPNPEKKRTVNHKNGIKTDNRLENLEWATDSENNQHAYDNGLKVGAFKGKHSPVSKPTNKSLNGQIIETYPSLRHACIENGIKYHTGLRYLKSGKHINGFTYSFL